MSRKIILGLGAFAVFVTYTAVLYDLAPNAALGPVTIEAVLIPGIVTGVLLIGYVLYGMRTLREATQRAEELSANLVRKEIEIGRLATVDELTGLYTRREFEESIRLEFERRRRHGRDLSLLILEIDDIAELGEHVGKLSKGYLLSEVSAILRGMLRAIDQGCRYSPESLALLLPETDGEQAQIVAEKVRKAIDAHEFLGQFAGEAMRVTVSQGIAAAEPGMSAPADLMRAAERALCDARAAGFDQVRLHVTEASTEAADAEALDGEEPPAQLKAAS